MIRQNMQLAFASLRSAKIRSLLTMVAVIIGVSSFVIVTSTVDGLKNATVSEVSELGGNLITVIPGDIQREDEEGNESFSFAAGATQSTLTIKDLNQIKKLDEVVAAAPLGLISAEIERGDTSTRDARVIATTEDFPIALKTGVTEGVFLNDDSASSRFVVLGTGVVKDLFAGEATLGSRITIKGESFTVIGIMEENESALSELFGFDQNNAVYISMESGEKLANKAPEIFEIDIQINEDVDPNQAVETIEQTLLKTHEGEKDFTVLTQDDLLGLIDDLLGIIKIAGQFLSFVMLFVASVVILLIMLITVTERTREIGIRKSIGATNNNILVQFLTEAVVISWVGSAIGLVVGYLLGLLLSRYAGFSPAYSVNTLLILVVISSGVGMIAGVIPAWMAARKDPVESLRHE